jgi:hypothetical protein
VWYDGEDEIAERNQWRRDVNAIKAVPAAYPEPQWIPCSETVDIPEEWVLACDERGAEMIGYLSYTYDQWLCESEHEIMYDPIAWRYLPEPWDGGDSE